MSSVVISGDTSGAITLAAPSVAGTNTITLPASTGTVLTTGSPQSGGVIQVVQGSLAGQTSTSSSSFVSTGLTATITPKFSTSKIRIICSVLHAYVGVNGVSVFSTLYRNSTTNFQPTSSGANQNFGQVYANSSNVLCNNTFSLLDSPATTSATTYTVYIAAGGGGTAYINQNGSTSFIQLLEIAA